MFVGAEVQIATKNADISFDLMPISVPEAAGDAQFVGLANAAPAGLQDLSGIIGVTSKPYDSDGVTPGGSYRIDFNRISVTDFSDSANAPTIDLRPPFVNILDHGLVTASTTSTLDKGGVFNVATVDSDYGSLSVNQFGTIGYLENTFSGLFDATRITSQTFDGDSDAVVGGNMSMANSLTTFDADEFSYYTDSA